MNYEDWVKQTNELVMDWEAERQKLHDKYDQIANELMDLDKRIETAHDLIRAYVNKYHVDLLGSAKVQTGDLVNKSYPEMLIEIAKQNNGILVVSDAANILLKAKVGTNKQAIAHNVSNTLSRMKTHFKVIARGQYRFTNHIENKKLNEQKVAKGKTKIGVGDAIKKIKEQNPLMTMREVTQELVKNGFDFQGRTPIRSVCMAWVALGYSREGKQQRLPIVNPPASSEMMPRIMPNTNN